VRQALQCGASPAWDLREGLRISAWVCPDAPPAGETAVYYPVVARPLAEKPAYALTLFREGDDLGQEMLRVAGSVTVIAADGKQHLLETLSGLVVPCNTWTKVSMEYSRSAIDDAFTFVRLLVNDEPASEPVCLVDDVPTDGGSYSGLIATSAEQLMIGTDKTDFFHGSIDEVTIDAIESSGRQVPPGNVQFSANTGNVVDGLYWITFDGAGRLEQWWEDPLPILAIYSPGSKTALLVGVELTGSIKTWRVGSDYAADEMTKWQQGDAQQNP